MDVYVVIWFILKITAIPRNNAHSYTDELGMTVTYRTSELCTTSEIVPKIQKFDNRDSAIAFMNKFRVTQIGEAKLDSLAWHKNK